MNKLYILIKQESIMYSISYKDIDNNKQEKATKQWKNNGIGNNITSKEQFLTQTNISQSQKEIYYNDITLLRIVIYKSFKCARNGFMRWRFSWW